MARLFNDAASDRLSHAAGILTAVPVTMACWFRSDSSTLEQTIMGLGVAGGADERNCFTLVARGETAGDTISARGGSPTGASASVTSTGYTVNTWHHACGVFAASNSRSSYIDGGSKGSIGAEIVPEGIDATAIGSTAPGGQFTSGDIAEAAIWDVALTDDEVAILGKGFSPLFVRPGNLVAYWPLLAYSSPELDRVGGFGMTVTGATKSDHPRIIYPSRARLILPAAAAVAANARRLVGGSLAGSSRTSGVLAA